MPFNAPAASASDRLPPPVFVSDQTVHLVSRFLAGRSEGGVELLQANVRKASARCEASSCRGQSFHAPRLSSHSFRYARSRLSLRPIDEARTWAGSGLSSQRSMTPYLCARLKVLLLNRSGLGH